MRSGFGNPEHSRTRLLKVILLAVLLGSVGAAWLLIRGSEVRGQRGAEILNHIRSKTLSDFWGTESVDLWFLRFAPDGRPTGWRRITREQRNGGYLGTQIIVDRGEILREVWRLEASAATGAYESTSPGQIATTEIRLSNGKVSVAQGRRRSPVTSKAPTNYIPEGLSSLVFSLGAKAGQKATCRMIFNNRAVDPGGVNFTAVRLVPRGPNAMEVTNPQIASLVYLFDERGLLREIERPGTGIVEKRVSRQDVLKHFRVP